MTANILVVDNEYLDHMTQIVFRHGGTTEKIVGDAVHAIFGAPQAQADHAARGVACAMEMDEFTESFRKKKNGEGVELGVTRIGVHSGNAIVGNVGGDLYHFRRKVAGVEIENTPQNRDFRKSSSRCRRV